MLEVFEVFVQAFRPGAHEETGYRFLDTFLGFLRDNPEHIPRLVAEFDAMPECYGKASVASIIARVTVHRPAFDYLRERLPMAYPDAYWKELAHEGYLPFLEHPRNGITSRSSSAGAGKQGARRSARPRR